MFKIDLYISDIPVLSKKYFDMTIDDVYNYISCDAKLTIVHKNLLFFFEEISIVEFYWCLCNWYDRYKEAKGESFIYNTIEHTKPIMEFSKVDDKFWKIDSIWRCLDKPIIIEEADFVREIKKLIQQLVSLFEA